MVIIKKCEHCKERLAYRKYYYLCKKCTRELSDSERDYYQEEAEKLLLIPQEKILKPCKPTNIKPGRYKVPILEMRYACGQQLHHPDDRKM